MSDLDWTPAGPRSRRFDDVYFSAEDGLAESRAVFLQGCGLPERWWGRPGFTVAELGFGTGLNVLALLDLWRRERPPAGRLRIFSIEAFPLTPEEAGRALAKWPELAGLAERLLANWPRRDGFHRLEWPELGATLDLAVAPAEEALDRWIGRADAWFLDGFAPSRNPEMWSEALLRQVGARSAPGATAATFTVAGHVRRALDAAGFSVAKRPGFGRKSERLEARYPGEAVDPSPPSVVVVGAGVAGAALCRAFRALGAAPTLIAPAGQGDNPAALVSPRFDAGAGPSPRLTLQAFRRAVALYTQAADVVIGRGLLQLESQARDARRFDAMAEGALFARGEVVRLDAAAVAERLSEPAESGGLWAPDAVTVNPAVVRNAWIGDTPWLEAEAAAVRRGAGGWSVLDTRGQPVATAEVVVLATGWGTGPLWPGLPLKPVRGQASWVAVAHDLVLAAAWGGYALPMRDGVLFGATHDRGRTDAKVAADDHRRNLASLAEHLPQLADRLQDATWRGRAAIRAVTPDRLPLAGRLEPGLFVLAGLGSRGFTWAPLLAEHVAAEAIGVASPLPADFAALVKPDRFAVG